MNAQETEARHDRRDQYCDRCARRALKLISDDLSLQELCSECYDQLSRRRGALFKPATPKP